MLLLGCIMQHSRDQTRARRLLKFVYQPAHILPELSSGAFCLYDLFVCGMARINCENELVYPGMKERYIFTRDPQQFTDDGYRQGIGKVIHNVGPGPLLMCIQ